MKAKLNHRRLAEELLRRNISQNRWAQILGVSRGYLSMLVNGQRPYPSAATRRKLLANLDLRFDDLFEVECSTTSSGQHAERPTREATRGRQEKFVAPSLSAAFRQDRSTHFKRSSRMQQIGQDLRYACRSLVGRPAYAVTCLLTLALGIGANTALFSLVNGVILNPLPYDESERIVRVWEQKAGKDDDRRTLSLPNFFDWRDLNESFTGMAAYDSRAFLMRGTEHPERVRGARVSDNFFRILGVRAAEGRLFQKGEDRLGADRVVVLSAQFRNVFFGERSEVLGRVLTLNDQDYTVVGVLPGGFEDPGLSGVGPDDEPQLWVPFQTDLGQWHRSGRSVDAVLARLDPGISLEAAQADMDRVDRILTQRYPKENTGEAIRIGTLQRLIVGEFRTAAFILLGAVGLVLGVACVNVANLSLSKAIGRRREMAIRSALGAGRGRIIRQLLTESVLLASTGGAFGLLLGWLLMRGVRALGAASVPRAEQVTLDGWVVLFTALIAVLTGILFGLAPALHVTGGNVRGRLTERFSLSGQGRRKLRLQGLLVAGEVALSLLLLVGAGLLARSLWVLTSVDTGFEVSRLLTMSVRPEPARYDDRVSVGGFHERNLDRIRGVSGVRAAAAITRVPMGGSWSCDGFGRMDRPRPEPGEEICAETRAATPGYLRTMGVALLRGRDLGSGDNAQAAPVMLVNETLVERMYGEEDPVGKQIWIHGKAREIIGVYADALVFGPETEPQMEILLDWRQDEHASFTVRYVVRTSTEVPNVAGVVRDTIWEMDAATAIYGMTTLEALLDQTMSAPRFRTWLFGLFAGCALLLAAVGIGGVLSCAVSRMTREIGIRMALGARWRDVLEHVLRVGFRPVLGGLAVGVAASFVLSRMLSSLLFGVSPTDPVAFLAAALSLLAVALAACWLPARRAAQSDPLKALRTE